MTREEIEVILNSDIPNYQKSELIKNLYDREHKDVSIFKEGGEIKPEFEDWISDVNPEYLSENYDLKTAYELYPFEQMEKWKKAVNSKHPKYYMNYRDIHGEYPYHLGSIAELPDGDFIFLKLGKEEDNPELHFETDTYRNGKSKVSETHDLVFDEDANRYFYRKKVESHKEGGQMKTLNPTETIQIGGKEYDVEIADTDSKRKDGLSRCKSLKKDEGMLFIFQEPSRDYFTMKETDIDLDIVFIDEDGVVISVESVEAHTPDPVICEREYKYVLEVCIDSEIEPGDELDQEDSEFTDEEKEQVKKSKMLVLNSDGDVQMKLVGGERIVSMIKTRQLIKAALKAYKSDNDSDYRRVGKLIFKELDAQDGRDPQYVEK